MHSDIAHIMASMDMIDVLQQQFFTAAQNDLMTRMASGEIDTEAKKNKLIEAYIDELSPQIAGVGEFAGFVACGGLIARRLVQNPGLER